MKITPQSSDAEINAAVALHVAGFTQRAEGLVWDDAKTLSHIIGGSALHDVRSKMGLPCEAPLILNYATSTDAVLPLLHARPEYCELQKGGTKGWLCVIGSGSEPRFPGFSQDSAARAVCYALLKAAAVEVEP